MNPRDESERWDAAGTHHPPTAPGDGIRGPIMRWAMTPTPNPLAPAAAAAARAESSAKQNNGGDVYLTRYHG